MQNNEKSLSILIAGDVVPTDANENLFIQGNLEALIGTDIIKLFSNSSISTINLECALTEAKIPIEKCGPRLKAHPASIKAIQALNPSLIGLANNHIMDFGNRGLDDTLSVLENSKFPYVGIGKNLEDASKSLHVIERKGWRIGFYACAEREFTIAMSNQPGANPFDPLTTGDIVKQFKEQLKLNKLIVLYHGGKEYYQYPSPELQRVCHHLVEKGADLIVCQHSHCIGAYEEYQGGKIVYGQGNFVFDTKHLLSKESLLVELRLDDQGQDVVFHPIKRKSDGTLYLTKGEESKAILEAFQNRSARVKEAGFIEKSYREFALNMLPLYLHNLSPFGKWFSRIDRHIFEGRIIRRLYSRNKQLVLRNVIECEAHREVLIVGLTDEV
jgi:poly-gamma-glutamate synthesis protein (capsule biosynthesis protein)